MMNKQKTFDVKNLSSRKLWELLSTDDCLALNYPQQQLAIQELLLRKHYLEQMKPWLISTPSIRSHTVTRDNSSLVYINQ